MTARFIIENNKPVLFNAQGSRTIFSVTQIRDDIAQIEASYRELAASTKNRLEVLRSGLELCKANGLTE